MGTAVELARCMGPVSAEMNMRVAAIVAVNARTEPNCIEGKRASLGEAARGGRNSTGIVSGSSSSVAEVVFARADGNGGRRGRRVSMSLLVVSKTNGRGRQRRAVGR